MATPTPNYNNITGLSAPQSSGVPPSNYNYYKAPITQAAPNNMGGYSTQGPNSVAWGTATPDEYVSKQLNDLVAQNNPYIQQARLQATNQANGRGIANSSIAAGNAQAAAIQAALPIATSDANMLATLQRTNLTDAAQQNSAFRQAQATEFAAGETANATVQAEETRAAEAMQAQREQLAYSGEQNQLQDQFANSELMQQYYNQSGLAQQNFNNQFGMQQYQDKFNLGTNLLQGQQTAYMNMGMQAMQDPAIMGNPEAFGGYMQWLGSPFSSYIDGIFQNLFGSTGSP